MFKDDELTMTNGTSSTISIGTWMKFDAIKFLGIIPFVGTLAVIIIYCVILFGSETAPSIKNRMIATLIWMAIGLVIGGLLLAIVGIGAFTALAQRMTERI